MKKESLNNTMFNYVAEIICKGERVTMDEIIQEKRDGEIVYPRQLIMFFSHELKLGSLASIGAPFGKDHCTVIHACKSIRNWYDTNNKKHEQIDEYRDKLNGVKKVVTKCDLLRLEVIKANEEVSRLQNFVLTLQNSVREMESIIDRVKI